MSNDTVCTPYELALGSRVHCLTRDESIGLVVRALSLKVEDVVGHEEVLLGGCDARIYVSGSRVFALHPCSCKCIIRDDSTKSHCHCMRREM